MTILLADEDALRRDGLSAVLSGTDDLRIIASVADGEAALENTRAYRPDVAVVDLNLPGIHGIELVRRIRSEALGTKVIVVAGTNDDDLIREVVRAGGDGYLLKNGPARHLLDAIRYVRDGGQYFSPQLHRDGRDRRLMEEPARPLFEAESPSEVVDLESGGPDDRRPPGGSKSITRTYRRARRPANGAPLRERIRESAAPAGLAERDYEIMTMMAEGIRPLIDRLDEIDGRVAQMETGDIPVPDDPRGWLSGELERTPVPMRRGSADLTRSIHDLEVRLPRMIEEAVTSRFNQMAGKLQEEIEESHVRTLDTFVQNVQGKLLKRVSALEQDMSRQAEAMKQLRENSDRTTDNLSRLIVGVDRLVQDLPRQIAQTRIQEEQRANAEAEPFGTQTVKPRVRRDLGRSHRVARILWVAAACLALLALLGWASGEFTSRTSVPAQTAAAPVSGPSSAATPASTSPEPTQPHVSLPPPGADIKTKLQAGQAALNANDNKLAEEIFRNIMILEPGNAEAITSLASALFREDRLDESASTLDKLPRDAKLP